jgi:carbon monoxide dehydrogenase subunit G
MKMTGDQRIVAPRQKVWESLNDPAVLKQCIPGCQSLEKESDTRLKAVLTIKVGPIGARFAGAVTLSDLDPPNSYTISGEGQGGAAGFAKGGARVRLAEDAGATLLSYDLDAQVGGRLAQLGGPIIDATAKQLAGSFFKRFGEIVAAESGAQTAQKPESQPPAADSSAGPAAGAAPPVRPTIPAAAAAAPRQGPPIAWILALVVAALVGFMVGRGHDGTSWWAGVAIGLLVLAAVSVGYTFGRGAASPVITLDAELLERLTARGGKP